MQDFDVEGTEPDAEAEADQACSTDIAQVCRGEAEVSSPRCHDAAAYTEADARCENGHETCPKQATRVRLNAVLFNVHDGELGGGCGG